MAQESQSNQSHGSISYRNAQLLHQPTVNILNSSFQPDDTCSGQLYPKLPTTGSYIPSSSEITQPSMCISQPSSRPHFGINYPSTSLNHDPINSGCQPANVDMLESLLSNRREPSTLQQSNDLMRDSRTSIPPRSSGTLADPNTNLTGSTSTPSTNSADKRKLIQQQLYYLLHAHNCQRLESSGKQVNCTNPHCKPMRAVLQHMETCKEGKNCLTTHCASSRQIISHWKNCNNVSCPVCEPLKNSQLHRQQAQRSIAVPTEAAGNSTNSPASNSSRSSNLPLVNSQVTPRLPTVSTLPGDSSSLNGITTNSESKLWQRKIKQEQRNDVVKQIVRFIFPYPDRSAFMDPRMRNLVEYARKVERDMYNSADSVDHYFHLLAQKCYKINLELDEKRKNRQRNNASNGSTAGTLASRSQDGQIRRDISLSDLPTSNSDSQPALSNGTSVPPTNGTELDSQSSVNSKGDPNAQVQLEDRLKAEFKSEGLSEPCVKEENRRIDADSIQAASALKSEPKLESALVTDSKPSTSPTSSSSTPAASRIDESKWKKWTREELLTAFLPLHEEICNDRHAEPFRVPVDPIALHIPDYFDVIKNPMDLATVRTNLEDGNYVNPWEVIEDFRSMFNNAWLYNRKTSKVHKMCSKLAELFQSRIDQVMQSMGFCCGQDFEYQPQSLYCNSANLCSINKDATYYVYLNSDKQSTGLVCDKYYQCEKCFSDANEVIILSDEPNQSIRIEKSTFECRKNNVKEKEENVLCVECGRQWHKVCALHMSEIWPDGFVCPNCMQQRNQVKKENRFSAKRLPGNRLSTFLEKRVNAFLKRKEGGVGEVTIRVLASSDKTVEVKPLMRARFTENGELSESFPYRLKAIFAFQEIDGQDVCFFGLYVQEYGSESPQPNRRRVYVAYLDSVFYFRPKQLRTDVYHEILVGYLHYAKHCGFTMAHIWACPPGEGDDYIFHMHPFEQRIPKAKRLQEWYRKMLQKAIIEDIVIDYKNILKDALEQRLVSPTDIPYFEGDFWPNTLEDILKELEEEEARRRTEEAEDEESDCSGLPEDGSLGDVGKRAGKKKAKKRKGNKKGNSTSLKRRRSDGPTDCLEAVSRKVYDTMEKLKEIFFVIRLYRQNSAASLPPINDPDPPIQSELMDSRDAFLQLARERHLEFSSLRRAKFSTMALLYELHMELRQSFMYNCNQCSAQIETRWHCTVCEEYDLCSRCYQTVKHPHQMVKYGLGIDEDSAASEDSSERSSSTPAGVDRRQSIERCIKCLLHACQCRDANCRIQTCTQMKRVLCHARNCTKKSSNSCLLCKQLLSLLWHHARGCNNPKCNVPFCQNIKARLKQKQVEQRAHQKQLLRRRISHMNVSVQPTAPASTVPDASLKRNVSSSSMSESASDSNLLNSPCPTGVKSKHPPTPDDKSHQKVVPSMQHSTPSVSSAPTEVVSRVQPSPQPQSAYFQPRPGVAGSSIPRQQPAVPVFSAASTQPSSQISTGHQPIASRHSSMNASSREEAIAQLASKAKNDEIRLVGQMINQIKASGASTEEQNVRFIDWIKKHPELHAAFFALHTQNRQKLGNRSVNSINERGNSLPLTSDTSSFLNAFDLPTNVVFLPTVSSSSSLASHLPGTQPQNIAAPNSIVSSTSTNGQHPSVLRQPVQWISVQSSAAGNHQALVPASAPNTATLQLRTVSGTTSLVQSQTQPAQTLYPVSSLQSSTPQNNSTSGSGVFVSSANGPTVPGQQLVAARLYPSSANVNTNRAGHASQPVVHFRPQSNVATGNPHIILTGGAPRQYQQQPQPNQVSNPVGNRQVVALMAPRQNINTDHCIPPSTTPQQPPHPTGNRNGIP